MIMMSEDAKGILLLCGHLGGDNIADPLNQREYNQVVKWLVEKNLRPADLLIAEHVSELARESRLDGVRLDRLLKRGVKLGFAVEKWNQSGIWVICRSDSDYPQRYREHLKDKAPPILFGVGDRVLLQEGGLAIVGSRAVDADGESFARDIAECCAREGVPVVSGGARGVDQVAMSSALEAGGVVVGVLADALLRRSVEREARRALSDRRLLLLSPYHPEAGFTVGNAMGRNKLIYGLADYGLVVSADYNKGGTWEGAIEELKRDKSLPMFIRGGSKAPKGNQELIKRGGIVFPCLAGRRSLRELFDETIRSISKISVALPLDLPFLNTPLSPMPVDPEPLKIRSCESLMVKESLSAEAMPVSQPAQSVTVLEAMKPLIIHALEKPISVDKLAKTLGVRKVQMQDWITALINDGILVEKVQRKSKIIAVRHSEEELRFY